MGASTFPLILWTLAFVSGVSSLTVTMPELEIEHARGDNITLPCTFKSKQTNPSLVVVTWTAVRVPGREGEPDDDIAIATYYSHTGRTDYKSRYDGRAKLDVKMTNGAGEANLKLYSITMYDTRTYECRLQVPGDDEGNPAETARMTVLVAPSPPICKLEGQAEYGQDLQLKCHSEEGSPPPTYTWNSVDVQKVPHVKDPKNTDVNGVYSLFNVTKETSGYYTCTSRNKIRSATCNITLAVMPPSMLGSVGKTAGIAAAVVGVLLILIIVICCCCRKKKKAQEEEYAMGVQEEYHDKEPTENGDRREVRDDDRDETDPRDRRDYDDRRSDYDDRRSDYNDRRSDYDDRRSDYDDRRSDYTERRSDYDDRRSDYTERRDRYDDDRDRRDRRYDDDHDRRDRRYEDDRHYDEAYDDRPPVPNNKPPRRDYDD